MSCVEIRVESPGPCMHLRKKLPVTDAPLVSVIIPHFNQPDFLEKCLASLPAPGMDGVPSYEVLVIDNGSKLLPEAVVARYPQVQLLVETEPGPGPARNKGVAAARGDILAFTDADCVIDPNWLPGLVRFFESHPEAYAVGGDVFILRGDPDHATPLEAYEGVYAFRTRMYIEKMGFTATNNLAVRASAMARVGPFGGKAIAEDRDWGLRARDMGMPVQFAEGMIIHHPARASFAELCKKWDRHTSHDYTDIHAKSLGRVRWLARAGALAVSPVAEIPRILRADRISGLRERLLAFWVLLKIRLYRAGIMLKMAVSRKTVERMANAWNS